MRDASGRFRTADRIRRPSEFRSVSRRGRRSANRHFVLLWAERENEPQQRGREIAPRARLGITASRKVGGAVVRNRVKRRIRTWFRTRRDGMEGSTDLVVIARRSAASLKTAEMHVVLDELWVGGSEHR